MFAPGWQTSARRWTKYPATLLFVVSLLWLVRNLFQLDWTNAQPETETGIGILLLLINLVIVPLGGVVVGIYLLFLKRWAFYLAPLLPLTPLIVTTEDKVGRIAGKFTEFREELAVPSLGGGVMDSFVLLSLWIAYAVMLWYLYMAWRVLEGSRRWRSAAVAPSGPAPHVASGADAEDVCMLLPEIDDAESA